MPSFHSETTVCWCLLERVLTAWRYLNNDSVWGVSQLCYHASPVIIYSDCAWMDVEGLTHYTLTGGIYSPIGAGKLHGRKLRKRVTTPRACHLRKWLQLVMDQQTDSFEKNPFVDLVRKHNFVPVSSLDKSEKQNSTKAGTCCWLFFNCVPWQCFQK